METLERLGFISVQIAALVGLAALLQWILRSWIAPRWRCWLWGLVVLRLCLPVSLGADWSLFNLLPRTLPRALPAPTRPTPQTESVGSVGLGRSTPPSLPAHMPAAPTRPLPLPAVLLILWALGAFAVLARTLWHLRRTSVWVATGRDCRDPALLDAVRQAAHLVDVRRVPSVTELPGLNSPALYGALRPRLLFPTDLTQRLDPAQLLHVLLHECAHIQRRDIALNWLLALLQAVYWFHPLVWFAFARLRAERELACDEIALQRRRCR